MEPGRMSHSFYPLCLVWRKKEREAHEDKLGWYYVRGPTPTRRSQVNSMVKACPERGDEQNAPGTKRRCFFYRHLRRNMLQEWICTNIVLNFAKITYCAMFVKYYTWEDMHRFWAVKKRNIFETPAFALLTFFAVHENKREYVTNYQLPLHVTFFTAESSVLAM